MKTQNEYKSLDRNLVRMAIDHLRNFNNELMKGMKSIMLEPQLNMKEYERYINPELNGIEWI